MTDDHGQTKVGKWVPFTRGGSMLDYLEADTEEQAWANLVRDNPHGMRMGKQALQEWGFEVDFMEA